MEQAAQGQETKTVFARAKINLTLHVGRVIQDLEDPFFGYHPVDSLVVFADVGDELRFSPSDVFNLSIAGPFAAGLRGEEDNLILRALKAAGSAPCHVELSKNLPVAAGIGGGSANAAAALRYLGVDDMEMAAQLGADVPVCLRSKTSHMTGVGETVTPLGGLGQLHTVLVNPGVAVSTAQIFKLFDARGDAPAAPKPQHTDGTLFERALAGGNDLQDTAITLQPVIGDVVALLAAQAGCALARMSGSGATCFGIFATAAQAQNAARVIVKAQPDWWVMPSTLGEI